VTEPGSTVTSLSPIPSLQRFPSQIRGIPCRETILVSATTWETRVLLVAEGRNPRPERTVAGIKIPRGSVLLP